MAYPSEEDTQSETTKWRGPDEVLTLADFMAANDARNSIGFAPSFCDVRSEGNANALR